MLPLPVWAPVGGLEGLAEASYCAHLHELTGGYRRVGRFSTQSLYPDDLDGLALTEGKRPLFRPEKSGPFLHPYGTWLPLRDVRTPRCIRRARQNGN